MKIAYISDAIYPYHKGGKEKRLYEIAKRLAKAGHQVHIYTMHWWNTPEKSRIENGVYLHAICKQYELYKGDRRSIKEGIFFAFACLKLLRLKADVIDVDHMPFFPVFTMWIVCRLKRRPLYGTWHESLTAQEWQEYMGRHGMIASFIEKVSVRLPTVITAASLQTQQLLALHHGRKHQVEVVASGVDLEQLANIVPTKNTVDVLYVGRLVKDKHVDQLILALAILRAKGVTAQCHIIGDGIERDNLQKFAHKLHIHDQLSFHGSFPRAEQIYAYMKAAKVFALPSTREGFGIVALEALGCNTPVVTVAAPANAAKALIYHKQNGSIVKLDAAALAEAIAYWLQHKPATILSKDIAIFDWNKLAAQQAEVYGI